MYPRSRRIVILAPISKAMFSGIKARSKNVDPVIDNLANMFRKKANAQASADSSYDTGGNSGDPSILVHAIYSIGIANYASALNALRLRHDRLHPHQLLICNGTPGSPVPSRTTLTCWSRAMALAAAQLLPWPFAVIYWLLFLMLAVNVAFVWGRVQEFPGVLTVQAVDDEALETKQANKLLLYSNKDDLILHQVIEALSEEMKDKGCQIWSVMFEGGGHFRHMPKVSGNYWRSVKEGWRWAPER